MADPEYKFYDLLISRLPKGGYLVSEPHQSDTRIVPGFLAAFSDLGEALNFIRDNIHPSAAAR